MKIQSKFINNISWIFFGNIIHAVLQYVINIICARSFGANDYGLINYAVSLIAFFVAIGTLGFNGIITMKFAEDEENAGKYIGTSIVSRTIFSIIAIIVLQIIVSFANSDEPSLKLIVFCQSLQILFGSVDLIIYWYRFKNNAKTVAIIRLAAFFISAIWRIVSIVIFNNIAMYVLGVSLEFGFFGVFLLFFYLKEYSKYRFSFDTKILISMFKTAYPFIFSAILSTIYGQTDKIMLKSMLDNSSVAMYSVSLTLAGAIAIIPTALIEGFRPEIMSYKLTNQKMYEKRLQQLYGLVFWICVCYCLFITIFAKQIILLLYGNSYIDAIPSLSLIVWYTSFSYFGAINNLYMVAEQKTAWVQVTTLIGAILNVILNIILIPYFGIVGASAASLLTQIITNFVLLYFIKPLRMNFFILIRGVLLFGFKK
jgi:O-antigen/teichoic acid export membrane protein